MDLDQQERERNRRREALGIKTKQEPKLNKRSSRPGLGRKFSLLLPPPIPCIASAVICLLAALRGRKCEQM